MKLEQPLRIHVPVDVRYLEEQADLLRASPEFEATSVIQNFPDLDPVPKAAELAAIDKVLAEFPGVTYRISDNLGQVTQDVSYLRLLPSLRSLSIELVGPVEGLEVLADMHRIVDFRAEFGKVANFDFLAGMTGIETLRLERASKGSVRPSVAAVASMPKLTDLSILGYKNGVEVIAKCSSLRRLHLQSVRLKSWDILPSQPMEYVCFSHLNGPEGMPQSFSNVTEFHAFGMERDPLSGIEAALTGPSPTASSLSVNIDALNTHLGGAYVSGYDWQQKCAELVSPPAGVSAEAEADGLWFYGPANELTAHRLALIEALTRFEAQGDEAPTGQ